MLQIDYCCRTLEGGVETGDDKRSGGLGAMGGKHVCWQVEEGFWFKDCTMVQKVVLAQQF